MKVIASFNGRAATDKTYKLLAGGAELMAACVEGVVLVEDDPDELTVGYGGLPNAEGVVELDAAVMHGPTHRVGGVAALRGIRNPSRVALRVLEKTSRVLLVGDGALKFALANGFVEENLLTDKARKIWEFWQRSSPEDWTAQRLRAHGEQLHAHASVGMAPMTLDPDVAAYIATHSARPQGTVHLSALDAAGDLACVTSTSGHAFKPPGRVGDSPIAGAGLYVDNAVGTCGSLGHGESNLRNCTSFLAVELMRGGLSPKEAGLEALRRVAVNALPEERDAEGRPTVDVRLFLLAADGRHAGVTMRRAYQIAVTDDSGTRVEPCTPLYD